MTSVLHIEPSAVHFTVYIWYFVCNRQIGIVYFSDAVQINK